MKLQEDQQAILPDDEDEAANLPIDNACNIC
jgi:hypothetical protein